MAARLFSEATGTWPSLGVVFLIILLVFHLYFVVIHMDALWAERRNFQAAIRLPLIVLCASVMNLAFIYAVALRQIFEVVGWRFPCSTMTFLNIIGNTSYVSVFGIKALHYLVIFNPQLRKKYIHIINPRGTFVIFMGCNVIGIIIWAILEKATKATFCKNYDFCHADNCFFQSKYYFTMPLKTLVDMMVSLPGSQLLGVQKSVREFTNLTAEVDRNAVAALVLLPASWIILILADQGIIQGDGWKWPVTLLSIGYEQVIFMGSVAMPAMQYGFSPLPDWLLESELLRGIQKFHGGMSSRGGKVEKMTVYIGEGGRAIFRPRGADNESEKATINPFSTGPTLHLLTGTSGHNLQNTGGSNERRQHPGGMLAAMATPDFQLKVLARDKKNPYENDDDDEPTSRSEALGGADAVLEMQARQLMMEQQQQRDKQTEREKAEAAHAVQKQPQVAMSASMNSSLSSTGSFPRRSDPPATPNRDSPSSQAVKPPTTSPLASHSLAVQGKNSSSQLAPINASQRALNKVKAPVVPTPAQKVAAYIRGRRESLLSCADLMELDVLNALLGEHLSRQGADVLYYYLSTIQNFEAEVKKLRFKKKKGRDGDWSRQSSSNGSKDSLPSSARGGHGSSTNGRGSTSPIGTPSGSMLTNHYSAATVVPWTPPTPGTVGERVVLSEQALEAEATKDRIVQMCGYILDEYFREEDLQAKALMEAVPADIRNRTLRTVQSYMQRGSPRASEAAIYGQEMLAYEPYALQLFRELTTHVQNHIDDKYLPGLVETDRFRILIGLYAV